MVVAGRTRTKYGKGERESMRLSRNSDIVPHFALPKTVGLPLVTKLRELLGVYERPPLAGGCAANVVRLNPFGDPMGTVTLAADLPNLLNTAYYAPTEGLFFLDARTSPELVQVHVNPVAMESTAPVNAGQIVESSFQTAAPPTALDPASLVQTIDTSKAAWNPSSPDPAGIAYRLATNGLFISDSEVEENHPDFQGFNVFEANTVGSLFATCSTTSFSNEPTGAAVNPANGHIFFSDDNANRVFEVDLVNFTHCQLLNN
jgi:hypothetical protein